LGLFFLRIRFGVSAASKTVQARQRARISPESQSAVPRRTIPILDLLPILYGACTTHFIQINCISSAAVTGFLVAGMVLYIPVQPSCRALPCFKADVSHHFSAAHAPKWYYKKLPI
jgi:hypothetical protein